MSLKKNPEDTGHGLIKAPSRHSAGGSEERDEIRLVMIFGAPV